MRKKVLSFFAAALLASVTAHAQKAEAILRYIDTYKGIAIEEMKRTGVPAAITLAQGIHESGAGMSKLVQESNNHFGIKCKTGWTGESVKHDDDAKGECFRKYPEAMTSYRDHSDFLRNGQRYAFLFLLDPADYQGWANGLKKAGYATNPKYPQILIKMIEDYQLQQYTMLALGKTVEEEVGQVPVQNDVSPAKTEQVQSVPAVAVTTEKAPAENIQTPSSYPQGLFTINETKVVFVRKGISYFAIASQYGVDLARIFEYNEIPRAEQTEADQLVYLQHKRKSGAIAYHTVTAGETLHDIAQYEGVTLESLAAYNGLAKNSPLRPGDKIKLRKKAD